MDAEHLAQWLFNAGYGFICVFGGWLLNNFKEAIKDLKKADDNLSEKVNHIEILVAGKYATRAEVELLGDRVMAKLDMIYEKLDGKADK